MKKYCYNCMREITTGTLCSDCVNLNIPKMAPHQLKPGTILKERYLVGNVIGEGGFGITYIGRDTILETKVAIKEFYPAGHINRNNEASSNLTISTEQQQEFVKKGMERFLEEARNVAQFSGESGIVNVKDFFEENSTAYIIMEYLEGQTLAAYIKNNGRMDADKVFILMEPIIRALGKMHKLGVIHRDISPDNIMYLNTGALKLMDFGSARYYAEKNKELTSTIKKGYAPEEQYTNNSEQGPWTDVYGLCATMYKCITGITPSDALDRMVQDTLERPFALGIRISQKQEEILMYGLAQHARDRCRNMDELLELIYGKENRKCEVDDNQTVYADYTVYGGQQINDRQPGYTAPQSGPDTGQPVRSEMRYDPNTGQPLFTEPQYNLNEGSQSYTQQQTYTQGYTQQQTYTQGYTQPQTQFTQQPYTQYGQQPYNPQTEKKQSKKKKVGLIIAGVAAVVVLAAGIGFAALRGEKVETFGDYYVTGCKEVMKVRKTEEKDGKVVAKLDNGEKVSLVEKGDERYWKVYIEAEDVTGFIDHHYLTNKSDAVMEPVTKYVNVKEDDTLNILSTPDTDGVAIGMAKRGAEVTVLAMPGDTYSYVYIPDESAFGYVENTKLAEEKPKEETKKTETTEKNAQPQTTDVIGAGGPPADYQGMYYVNVAKGYLALRNAKSFDAANEIGKMYNGDYVYAIKTNGEYWYVYSPSLGAYGYTNGNYLVSSYSNVTIYDDNVYYANVEKGYLALRSDTVYDASNEIGKIANGQEVYVVSTEFGAYWYVYVPSLDEYGYVNSEYLRK